MTEQIRQAIHDAIHSNPAGLKGEVIAGMMGIDPSCLYRYGDLSGKPIPLERLLQFVLITQDLRPVMAICSAVGGAFTPLPNRRLPTEHAATKALKEFADVMRSSSL